MVLQSTINPAIPVPGTALDAIQIQGNFAAAANDITAIIQAISQGNTSRGIDLVVDGGGVAIIPGFKDYLYVPYACTIVGWTIMSTVSGSIIIDVWKVPYASFPPTSANSITGGTTPSLTSALTAQSSNLSGWSTTQVNAGDVLGFSVRSASGVTHVDMCLSVIVG